MADDCVSEEKFEFPECWKQDVRMNALFAPFRSKSVNPTDWNSKMKFWTDLIENWCKFTKSPVLEISSLKQSFCRKHLTPSCLEDVFQHLSSTGILVNKDTFMLPDENWKSWAFKVVSKPFNWTFNTVKNTLIKGDEKQIYYVHVPVVKYLSEELLKKISATSKEKIVKFEDLMQSGFETPENLSIVLHWMQKQGQAVVSDHNGVTLVKLAKSPNKSVKITETDLGIYSLGRHEKVLEKHIMDLYNKRNAALETTKKHLANKMRELAKISLQRKKELEKIIEKQTVAMENIQAILSRIEQVKLESEVIECYQKGVSVLKQIYQETGLNPQDVRNTMDELEEVLNSGKEIDEALARPMDPTMEESLEEELNELLLMDAPNVPTNELPVTSEGEKNESKNTEELKKRFQALSI